MTEENKRGLDSEEEEIVEKKIKLDTEDQPVKKETETNSGEESFKLKVDGFGKFCTKKSVSKVFENNGILFKTYLLYNLTISIKVAPSWSWANVSFESKELQRTAIDILSGLDFKGTPITTSLIQEVVRKDTPRQTVYVDDGKPPGEKIQDQGIITSYLVTPLWRMPYPTQLVEKRKILRQTLVKWKTELFKFFPRATYNQELPDFESLSPIKKIKLMTPEQRAQMQLAWIRKAAKENDGIPCPLLDTLPSPEVTGYRSKCEFTFGKDLEGQKTCGFLLGLFKQNVHAILNPAECLHVSKDGKMIANLLQEYVRLSAYDVFDRIEKRGVYRLALCRTLGSGECMVMLQIDPSLLTDIEVETEKEKFTEWMVRRTKESGISLNSLFIQLSSDVFNGFKEATESILLHGSNHITETILGQSFQISPSSFFQVNPSATEVLYLRVREIALEAARKAEGELLLDGDYVFVKNHGGSGEVGVVEQNGGVEVVEVDDGVKVDIEEELTETSGGAIEILDVTAVVPIVVAGTDVVEGTVTTSEMPVIKKNRPGVVLLDLCCGTGTIGISMAKHVKKVIGVEMVAEAIEDAKKNALANGITNITYLCGKVEKCMHEIFKYHVAPGDTVIAILDPPRSGMHPSVIKSIRDCQALDHIIFIACAAKSSLQNFVDLSRPTSNKFGGFPFVPVVAVPVDLFPHTEHCELVIELRRQKAEEVFTE